MSVPTLEAFAALLDASAPAHALRVSLWLYPLVNTAHVLGIALLVGAIAALDLRLLGAWRGVAVEPLVRVLVPVAAGGVLLAVASGVLLFITRAPEYVAEPLFGIKLALIGAALLNALALRASPAWRHRREAVRDPLPRAWRVAAGLSLLLWLAVLTAGRLIGYR